MTAKPMKRETKEIVVDGYNLIHKLYPSPSSAPLDLLRQETEQQLLLFQQETDCPVTIVYDGKGSPRESALGSPLHIVFTPASKSADLWIIEYVKTLNTKVKKITIISSDDEIRRYTTAFGATCVKSEVFALQLKAIETAHSMQNNNLRPLHITIKDKKFNKELLSDQEVARWVKLFKGEKS
jgi:predicted RNA-binding protein with PIN domain